MSIHASQILYELTRSGLLSLDQVAGLVRACFWGEFPAPSFVQEMLRTRGWVTDYQFNEVMRGRAAGLRVGKYLVLDKLGEGGFGHVYRARENEGMQRQVTLKILRPEFTSDRATLQRFMREMMVVGRFSFRHLVSAIDADHDRDTWYLVLEYVRGYDLKHLVARRGPLPWLEALEYVRQVADGLTYIQRQGLIHRDIKPSNLLREDPTGVIKILDLGLAKVEELFPGRAGQPGLTHTGLMIGTPEYMAPEQFEDASHLDIRADVYSLGCVLYFLLAGRPPFVGASPVEVLQGVLEMEPDPIRLYRPDVPESVARLLRQMMAKRPEDRVPEPAVVSQTLRRLLAAPPATTPLPSDPDIVPL